MSRRIAYAEVGAHWLLDVFRSLDGHQRDRMEGLPSDARIVGFSVPNPLEQGWTIPAVRVFFESDAFDEVTQGRLPAAFELRRILGPSGGMDEYNELLRTVTLLKRSLADTRQLVNKLIAGFPHDLGEIPE